MSTFDELRSFALGQGIDAADLPSRPPAFERRLVLDGNFNFRDAGGYVGLDGRTMPRGVIFRSDHLAELTDADLASIERLGLRVAHDFRIDSERERQPSRTIGRIPRTIELATADLSSTDETVIDVVRDMLAGLRPLPEADFWETNYLDMLEAAHRMLVAYVRSVSDESNVPALHHCTGGKDRTGISTALLHRLLGVSDDDIVDDFLLTNLYRTPYRVEALREGFLARGIDPLSAIPILGVTRRPIERVLETWDATGGAEAYALAGGLTVAELDQLRTHLLR